MKLRRLWLGSFQNLDHVEIPFDDSPSVYGTTSIRFFVGRNGSGKSHAIEAIGLIFSHLAANASPGFEFDIEYELARKIIRITTRCDIIAEDLGMDSAEAVRPVSPIGAVLLVRNIEEQTWEPGHMRSEWASSGSEVIPGRVVGYSTGPTSGLQWALSRSIDRFVKNALGEFEGQERPDEISVKEWEEHRAALRDELNRRREAYLDNPTTLFLGSNDALCAVLALLAFERTDVSAKGGFSNCRGAILSRVNLDRKEPIAAFTLRVSGSWYELLTPARKERFKALLSKATVRREIDPDPQAAGSDRSTPDFYAVYDLDRGFAKKLATLQPMPIVTPLAFFEELLAWKRQGALLETRLVLRKEETQDLLSEWALSDGEFLYLGRFALLLMLRDIPECLILLDEPETHFNDHWKVDLISDIRGLLGSESNGQPSTIRNEVIIATHSDLTLTDADPRQVYVFTRELNDGRGQTKQQISVEAPRVSPFGANRGEVSKMLFDVDGPIGSFSRRIIEEALKSGTREEVEQMLLEIAGPGFYRFQLRDRLRELTTSSSSEGDDAPSNQNTNLLR